MNQQEYAGFWIRVGAGLIDTILLMLIILPILTIIYGSSYWQSDASIKGFWDGVFLYVVPALAAILFWMYKSATPGKLVTKLKIVNAKTGDKPSVTQFIIRYIGYFLAMLPLLIGIFWVGFDKRKQGWHDKLAGTVVIKTK